MVHRLWCTGMGCGAQIVMQWMGCGAWGQGSVHSTKCISGILHGRERILQGWQRVSWNELPCRPFIPSSPALFQPLLEMSPS